MTNWHYYPYFPEMPMTQRAYLQELCNKYGDFKVCRMWKDSKGESCSTKWQSVMQCWESEEGLRFLDKVNNRQILPCEVVLDLEVKSHLIPALAMIKELGWSHAECFKSGSRGFHIHAKRDKMALRKKHKRQELRKHMIQTYFPGADMMKASDNSMIALEWAPHWKTECIKEPIKL